jgi:hypothetical protein
MGVYTLSVVPGPAPLFREIVEQAVELAAPFATQQGVRAWLADGTGFRVAQKRRSDATFVGGRASQS